MSSVAGAAIRGTMAALGSGRILVAILLANLAIAAPVVLTVARAYQNGLNHRVDPDRHALGLDFAAVFEMSPALAAAEPAFLGAGLASFLLMLVTAGGWLESLSRRDGKRTLRTFAAGGAGFFSRFLRLALLALLAIAAARWLFYGKPSELLLRLLIGSASIDDFSSERAADAFRWVRSIGFAGTVALVVCVSDLGRAAIVVRGGRSALVGATRGLTLLGRHPMRAVLAVAIPLLVERLALLGVAWLVAWASSGEATAANLAALFLTTQVALVVREVTRAGRLAAMLEIARADADTRAERRYREPERVPIVAAAGHAMTSP